LSSHTVQDLAVEACKKTPEPLQPIYEFVQRYRPETAEETVRARLYEAMEQGRIIRIARGVYFARSGSAQLLLIEGDAWEVMPKLEEGSIDALITDPPFDMGTKKWVGKGTTRPHAFMGGERTYQQRDIDREWLAQAFRILKKSKEWNTLSKERKAGGHFPRGGGACAIFVPSLNRSTYPHIRELIELAESVGFVFYGSVTWDKGVMGMGYHCGRDQVMEILLFTAGERNGVLWDLGMPNILSVKKVNRRCAPDAVEHEAEKPSELWVRLAKALTREGEIVFDPFCGRARWVKEVLSMNRHVIAADIDGKWLDRIAQEDFGYRFDLAQIS